MALKEGTVVTCGVCGCELQVAREGDCDECVIVCCGERMAVKGCCEPKEKCGD
ncbi:MAG: hypothetical protein QF662_02760 [Phycisphaerae bacterium]|jgi:hypothetical protein|nr:hypothetical protein [Phycisphaerae bacterium]